MDFGLTLPTRGVDFGATTYDELMTLARLADESSVLASLWIGDSLLAKPRPESLVLLSGAATITSRVRLGTACMASFVLRDPILLAYQWATFDQLSGGRSVIVVCTGIVEQAGAEVENLLYRTTMGDRVARMTEWIQILKMLWTEDEATFHGRHYQFDKITIEPKPAARPHPPIWLASNARDPAFIPCQNQRVARLADGWQTSLWDHVDLKNRIDDIERRAADLGRGPDEITFQLYHNFVINEDIDAAIDEARRFLEAYYMIPFTEERVRGWVAVGNPEQVASHLAKYQDAGFDDIALRAVSWSQQEQVSRLINEVLPALT